ncbi:MAG: carboxypeptidase-like regulatory domain-containing protein [Bacteroidota bacterium]
MPLSILYLFIFLKTASFQQSYVATIVDAKTGKGLAKVTVRTTGSEFSTETDAQGKFAVTVKLAQTDTLLFSFIGYKTAAVPVKDLNSRTRFTLEEDSRALKEVVVSNKKRKVVTLNKVGGTREIGLHTINTVAQPIKCPEAGGLLQSVIFHRKLPSTGINPQTKFVLRIYDTDPKNGGPGAELLPGGLEVTNKKDERIVIDLSSYRITIPKDKFFVGIEWLIIPFNQFPIISVSRYPVALDEQGKQIPWTAYQGSASYQVGASAGNGALKGYQLVKGSVSKGINKTEVLTRETVHEDLMKISYYYSPILATVLNANVEAMWTRYLSKNTGTLSWHFNNNIGSKLAISADVIF